MEQRAEYFSGRDAKYQTAISQVVSNSIKVNVESGGRPKWPARKADYQHPILDLTGTMRDVAEQTALTWHNSGGTFSIKIMGPEYGIFHQYGSSKLAVRKYVLLQQFEVDDIKTLLVEAFR